MSGVRNEESCRKKESNDVYILRRIMSTTSDHLPLEEMIEAAVQRERKRDVGMVLEAYGICKLSGQEAAARVLDSLATKMENEDGWGGQDS